MATPRTLVRDMRLSAGLSQRALAQRAGTSQPAVVRYEKGGATPSWDTLQRLAAACGRRLKIEADPIADPHDLELTEQLLGLTPIERLEALRRFARLHEIGRGSEA